MNLLKLQIILEFPYTNSEYIPIKPLKYVYRKSMVKNFMMLYTIEETKKVITIVRVLYQKRDIDRILD